LRPLSPVSKADVEQLLPGGTRRTYQAFSRRGTCGLSIGTARTASAWCPLWNRQSVLPP